MKKLLLFTFCFYSLLGYSQVIGLTPFSAGFTAAVAIEHPANDPRLFVVEQAGLIRILNTNGTTNATPFLNISSLTSPSGERGLLGLAFHPNYATNGLFFVNYTRASDGSTVIARYSVSADPSIANTTATILMTINQPSSNHNGGTLRFGPDGYLYIGMGDGGGAGDTSGYAQNLDIAYPAIAANPSRIYLGKMLRIDVNTTAPGLNYGFPATNPFVAQAGKQEIWAYGVRNPWKFSFNRLNGDLWIADVGQGSVEEINKITTPLPNTGMNFGWRCYEGNAVYSTTIGTCPAYTATVAPLTQYGHTGGRCSVTGGYYYTGTAYPNLSGKYIIADFCTAEIGTINAAGTITWGYDSTGYAGSFGEDMNGELYISISTQYSATTPSSIFKVVDTLGTTEFEKMGFSLYPNPSSDTVFIKSTTDVLASNIELYDITGKLLLSKKADATSENSISVANLAKGMYVVTVETTNGNRYNTKLVVE